MTGSPMAEAAVAYAERGLAVVPVHTPVDGGCSCRRPDCPSPGKHPRVRWQQFQQQAPTVDDVRRWWRRWPDANIGVLTGRVSGVVVLDVDPRNGGDEALAALEARLGPLPVTPEVRTGGDGRHLWFAAPEEPVPSGPLAPGLDRKGEGGMVIAPPSRHHTGCTYRWVVGLDDAPLAGLPDGVRRHPTGTARSALGGGAVPAVPVRTDEERREFADAWARAGVTLVAGDGYYRCPFHPDHHPSLHVDADGCRWFCFGCGRGGGIGALRKALGEAGPARPRRRIRRSPPGAPRVTLPGRREVDVVGESHHQDALLALTGGRRSYGGAEVVAVAELRPDPANPHDPAAVAVLIEGQLVGWLRHPDAVAYHPLIDQVISATGAATCQAVIRGGWDRGHGDVAPFGVVLHLP